jgi:hypothetical protein
MAHRDNTQVAAGAWKSVWMWLFGQVVIASLLSRLRLEEWPAILGIVFLCSGSQFPSREKSENQTSLFGFLVHCFDFGSTPCRISRNQKG